MVKYRRNDVVYHHQQRRQQGSNNEDPTMKHQLNHRNLPRHLLPMMIRTPLHPHHLRHGNHNNDSHAMPLMQMGQQVAVSKYPSRLHTTMTTRMATIWCSFGNGGISKLSTIMPRCPRNGYLVSRHRVDDGIPWIVRRTYPRRRAAIAASY